MTKFNLAALLSKVNLDENDQAICTKGIQNLRDNSKQLDFFEYCKEWKLAPWVFIQLKMIGLLDYIEKEVVEKFEAEHNKIEIQNNLRNDTAAEFLSEFIKEGIDVVILKGNYLNHSCYENIGYKRMNDFDILIHKEDWDRIQDVYLRLGYIPLGFGWSGEKEKPATFSHVGMSFISKDYSCIIGSQWGLKSPTTAYIVDLDKIWKTTREFDFKGLKVKCLSPEYNLLHLILHLGVFKCGIRDCMDLYNLVRTHSINEDLMRCIIEDSNASSKAAFALGISNLCTPEFSQQFIESLNAPKRGFLNRRFRKRKLVAEYTGDIHHSYNDYFQDIEKQVVYFNLFPKFHLKFKFYFRILKMIYFPKMEYSLRLNDKLMKPTFVNKLISAIKAPYFVFNLIAQEIGWKFTCLLFIKLAVDLIVSLKNYIIQSKSYFDYLKLKGVDPEEIQNAVKNIQ